MQEDRLMLCLVLIVLSLFWWRWERNVTKLLNRIDGLESNSPLLNGDSPYLYKGDGRQPKEAILTRPNRPTDYRETEEEWETPQAWGQNACPNCNGIKGGRFVGYKDCQCPGAPREKLTETCVGKLDPSL